MAQQSTSPLFPRVETYDRPGGRRAGRVRLTKREIVEFDRELPSSTAAIRQAEELADQYLR